MAETPTPPATPATPRPGSGRRMLVLIALVASAPFLLAVIVYNFFPRSAETNYGTLLPVGPAPALEGRQLAGPAFRLSDLGGRWVVLVAAPGGCDAACGRELYATRQARTIQGRESDRVVRVWLVPDGTPPSPALLKEHPDLMVAQVDPAMLARLPAGEAGSILSTRWATWS